MTSTFSRARAAVVLVGLSQAALALCSLTRAGLTHSQRSAFVADLAVAVGLLAAAWQPWRAGGLVPPLLVLSLLTAAASAVDVAGDDASPATEARHLLVVIATVLVCWLRRSSSARPPGGRPNVQLRGRSGRPGRRTSRPPRSAGPQG